VDTAFGGQFLWIEAMPSAEAAVPAEERAPTPHRDARTVARHFEVLVDRWRKRVQQRAREGKLVLWGAGSKGITFLNMLSLFPGTAIDYVVDLNPHKHGRFVPGTGQRVIPPSMLPQLSPDAVLVMNAEYEAEITDALRSMKLGCEVIVVKEIPPNTDGRPALA
jgi:hypothetical protein